MGKQVSAKDRAFEKERGLFRRALREKEQEIREKENEISRLSAEKGSLEETIRQQAEWIERLLEYRTVERRITGTVIRFPDHDPYKPDPGSLLPLYVPDVRKRWTV